MKTKQASNCKNYRSLTIFEMIQMNIQKSFASRFSIREVQYEECSLRIFRRSSPRLPSGSSGSPGVQILDYSVVFDILYTLYYPYIRIYDV